MELRMLGPELSKGLFPLCMVNWSISSEINQFVIFVMKLKCVACMHKRLQNLNQGCSFVQINVCHLAYLTWGPTLSWDGRGCPMISTDQDG